MNSYHLINNDALKEIDNILQRNIARLHLSLNDYILKAGGEDKLTDGQKRYLESRQLIIRELMNYHEINLQFNNDRESYIYELQCKIRQKDHEISELKTEKLPLLLSGSETEKRRFNSLSVARNKWPELY